MAAKAKKTDKASFDPKAEQRSPVLVTTELRGVFQGDLESYNSESRTAIISQSRCCVQWRGIKGFVALAATGPTDDCRITPAAPSMTIEKVTSISECTPAAVEAWQSEPWS